VATEEHWTTTPVTAELLRGAVEVERTAYGVLPHRLPARARAQCADPQLAMVESQPSGVRVAFRTRATVVELEARPTKRVYVGAPNRPDGLYELLVDGEPAGEGVVTGGTTMTIDLSTGSVEIDEGPAGTVRFPDLPDRDKTVEVWLPHNETTELVALRTDAPVAPARADDRRVWVHHGSSISHGSNADRPTGTWPAVAAARAGAELVNLGLGGSALVDQFTARTIRDLPADVISIKLGINVTNADVMRLRAFGPAVHGFLDTIRDGHPTTPVLVVSPVWCGIQEETPGPVGWDLSALGEGRLRFQAMGDPAEVAQGKLTLQVVRTELARVVEQRAAEDPHLFHLDGLQLYGEADAADLPLPDDLHPDTATHRLIGERFAELAFGAGGPLAG
jgi:hypothetical protein